MTSPEIIYTGGPVAMDGCPLPMHLCISTGFVWDGVITRRTQLGAEADWPAGTATRIRFSCGTGTELIIAGTVDGPRLVFHMTAAETEQLPRGTVATVDLNWDSGDPDLWRPWWTGGISCR
jgi:hypothetical protein